MEVVLGVLGTALIVAGVWMAVVGARRNRKEREVVERSWFHQNKDILRSMDNAGRDAWLKMEVDRRMREQGPIRKGTKLRVGGAEGVALHAPIHDHVFVDFGADGIYNNPVSACTIIDEGNF